MFYDRVKAEDWWAGLAQSPWLWIQHHIATRPIQTHSHQPALMSPHSGMYKQGIGKKNQIIKERRFSASLAH